MSNKIRINTIKIEGYYFPSIVGLYWHSGYFWYNENKCKKINNNGSLSILIFGSKKSIKKLRTEATKCTIELEKNYCPF